ncbi:diadenosine tetraphosphate (Ap4A) HIT family hydrolase [Mumia flava]|uniref:Diadenosine tetraphosphate (Ap4A) HIT family hydrolase n=1 Tax=Mumia flava TaxID=1348852 RepID=A0A0B2BGY5_9ACTN|nr:HIT family protein [Mumia flava]PJJ56327.1 diadenosine tetraphosphate (Ap4A) HIT family hydrolase [Mumia flava]
MSTLFTKIIDGEIPGRFLWADDRAVAFLTIGPIRPGHALVVPRQEVDHWLDADDDLLAHLTQVAKRIGSAQQAAFAPPRIGLMVAGFEVPHLHVHVWPVHDLGDFSFERVEQDPDPARLDADAAAIREALVTQGDGAHVPPDVSSAAR